MENAWPVADRCAVMPSAVRLIGRDVWTGAKSKSYNAARAGCASKLRLSVIKAILRKLLVICVATTLRKRSASRHACRQVLRKTRSST
jgi:hypothetical protein